MPILRRVLAVSAVAAASTITFALPASAHSGAFERSCDHVTMHLNNDFPAGKYNITVLRNGETLETFSYDTSTDPRDKVFDESNEGSVTYKATWSKVGGHDNGTIKGAPMDAPKDCEPEPTPSPTPTEQPTASPSPTLPGQPSETPEPTVMPSTPETEAPTAAPSSSAAAVQGAKLANTGASNTVPMVIIGAVLVAGGAGLTFFTRRRRSASSAS